MTARQAKKAITGVPTNIILGAHRAARGRLLKHLLCSQPPVRWALLDNDALMPSPPCRDGVVIAQEASGCLCCNGPVLRVALTRLLREARPERLLIAPAPQAAAGQLMKLLADPWLSPVLDIRATLLVLDVRLDTDSAAWNRFQQESLQHADLILIDHDDPVHAGQTDSRHALMLRNVPQAWHAIHGGRMPREWLDRPGRPAPRGLFRRDDDSP